MKKLFYVFAVMAFASCNNNANNNVNEPVTNDTLAFGENAGDTLYFWNVDNEQSTRIKVLTEEISNPNVQAIINGLNMVYPDILIQFSSITNDTLNVSISQSEKLTQQIGTSGAAQFFATACVNLFETHGINYIHFDFTAGDHAKPGTFSRQQFADIKEVK
ncbi:MAG: hypothetical protein HYR66_17805 [Sphingobacteriales bacterium]|nr:hypothetical protein [Sphingobacteriales bacterium]MBI3720507.1 hypothetical protein [Sphingobacteriales bacterium]